VPDEIWSATQLPRFRKRRSRCGFQPPLKLIYGAAPASADGQSIRGDGWTLELNSGWAVTAGERKGDFTLKKSQ